MSEEKTSKFEQKVESDTKKLKIIGGEAVQNAPLNDPEKSKSESSRVAGETKSAEHGDASAKSRSSKQAQKDGRGTILKGKSEAQASLLPSSSDGYADFLQRFASVLIDAVILYFIQAMLFIPILVNAGHCQMTGPVEVTIFFVFASVSPWLYFALFESSEIAASPGKKLLGLKVLNAKGEKFSFWGSTSKLFVQSSISYVLWWILCFGFGLLFAKNNLAQLIQITGPLVGVVLTMFLYCFVFFTEKRQSFFDIITRRYVVRVRETNSRQKLGSENVQVQGPVKSRSVVRTVFISICLMILAASVCISAWDVARMFKYAHRLEDGLKLKPRDSKSAESIFIEVRQETPELSYFYNFLDTFAQDDKSHIALLERAYLAGTTNRGKILSKRIMYLYHENEFAKIVSLSTEGIAREYRARSRFWEKGDSRHTLPDLYCMRGISRAKLGQLNGALNDYNRSIELDPFISEVFYLRADVLKRLGRNREAKFDESTALSLDRNSKFFREVERKRDALIYEFRYDKELNAPLPEGLPPLQRHLAIGSLYVSDYSDLEEADAARPLKEIESAIELCKRSEQHVVRLSELYELKSLIDTKAKDKLADLKEVLIQIDLESGSQMKSKINGAAVKVAKDKVTLKCSSILDLDGRKLGALERCSEICQGEDDFAGALKFQQLVLEHDSNIHEVRRALLLAGEAGDASAQAYYRKLEKELEKSQ